MSDDKRIVGSGKVLHDETSDTYSTEYYLLESELAEYEPQKGDVAGWAPVPARVTRVSKSDIINGRYILSIEAEADETALFFGSAGRVDITDKFQWEYEDLELYYPPKLWGVRRAAKDDVKKNAVNIYGKTAKVKDFIFKNYGADTANHKGSADYSESPFSVKYHPPISMLGHLRDVPHLRVVFYSEKSPKLLGRFCGINGKFPHELEVHNGNISGKWRLRDQKLGSYTHNGKEYVKVTRLFGYAWGGLWDPDKCIGYWQSWEKGGIKEK